MPRLDSEISQQRWEACISLIDQEVPAWGAVQVVAADLARDHGISSDEPLLTVVMVGGSDGVTSGFSSYYHVQNESYVSRGHKIRFNGPVPIPAGGFGYVTRDAPTHALCHSLLGPPTFVDNSLFVPVIGQFYLGQLLNFVADQPVLDFIGVWNAAFFTKFDSPVAGCLVGYMTPQSRVMGISGE